MEERREGVAFPPRAKGAAEGRMVRADLVQEIVARRQGGERPRAIDPYIEFIEQRGPEVNWNGVVLHRELVALRFSGSYQQVQRQLKPRRDRRRWQEAATVRFETEPGEQAGRLRPAAGVDRGAAGDRPPVRVHVGLFAAPVYPRVPQRKAGHAARRTRARFAI